MLSLWVMALTWMVSSKTFSAAQDPALEEAWRDWKRTYRKVYAEGEEAFRRSVWENNVRVIEQHNREADEGKHSYRMGINHFSDMTQEEINQRLTGKHPH
ncbi:cathepsin L1-like [Python bivittatus]|uniref:Cathepsin L1-like n=1 Tax=Python bivittatus TaxID=176946 RepID=A0A9F2WFL0_PYTBI|nr:cathepsin L1-like [Python bivittatus]